MPYSQVEGDALELSFFDAQISALGDTLPIENFLVAEIQCLVDERTYELTPAGL